MRKPKERIIYNNYDLWDDYAESAKQYLIEENKIEEIGEEDIWKEIRFQNEISWDEEKERLKKVFDRHLNEKFLAMGTSGRWNGNRQAGFMFNNFDELMQRFTDCEYIKIWDENGHLFMEGTHYDGTHGIEIKLITYKGNEYYENWDYYKWGGDKRTEYQVYDKMFNDSHYTKLIHFAHKFYGCPKRAYEKKTA